MSGPSFRLLAAAVFAWSAALLLYELLLTRIFAVVLFASYAHLALALALLGMSAGATVQHLWPNAVPERGLGRRLGWIGLGLGLSSVLAIAAALYFPVLRETGQIPMSYQDTSYHKEELLNQGWFAALLPVLSLPFGFAGVAFAGAFQRLRVHIGKVYAADLVGGALGALIFVPLLTTLAGPDVSLVVVLTAALGSACAFAADEARGPRLGSLGLAGLSLVLTLVSTQTGGLLRIHHTAGFSEGRVTYTQWTPLTRLAVHVDSAQTLILLDNASASQVPMTAAERTRLAQQANRAMVYNAQPRCGADSLTIGPDPIPCTALDHEPRVAILAASAGPEVAVAQLFGYQKIDAIDIAAEIFDIVATRFPDSPVNPYLQPGVERVYSDGRAAILRSTEPYDVIQMVHANLWSAAGILANTWSPALLETRDAFTTYLDHLAPDGVISFGRGDETEAIARSAGAALRARGVERPWQSMAWIKGNSQVLLVRGRPWTDAELARLDVAMTHFGKARLTWDMRAESAPKEWKNLMSGDVMTDDRPYVDTANDVQKALTGMWTQATGTPEKPLATLYFSLIVQFSFVLVTGLVFVGAPLLWRGRGEMAGVTGVGAGLAYMAGLGYGYLSVETVLIHDLVLFVGHPTWAITVVVLAMLTGSGAGAWYAGEVADRAGDAGPTRALRIALAAVIALAVLYGTVVPPFLHAVALGWPIALRIGLTFTALLPLGFLMGMPFPLALRAIRPSAAGIVPWCWAMNGWMSVLGSLATVVVARLEGYTYAYGVAVLAYVLALVFSGRLRRVGA